MITKKAGRPIIGTQYISRFVISDELKQKITDARGLVKETTFIRDIIIKSYFEKKS